MAPMAFKSLGALASAIADVKKELGDSAEHKALLSSLDEVAGKLGDEAPADDKRDSEDDDYSFDTAEKRHVTRNSERGDDAAGSGDAK